MSSDELADVVVFDAAVSEAASEAKVLTIAGRECKFPAKLPLGIAAALQMQKVGWVYQILADGDEKLLEHLVFHMTEDDIERLAPLYGVTAPES